MDVPWFKKTVRLIKVDVMVLLLPLWVVSGAPSLEFPPNGGPLKVAIMADLHYGENVWSDWGPAHDINSTAVQGFVLDTERPDFVVYLGDLVTANNVGLHNASAYWAMATGPTVNRSIPFSTIFGNHDDTTMVFEDSWFGPAGSPLPSPGTWTTQGPACNKESKGHILGA